MVQAARFGICFHLLVPFIVEAALQPGVELEKLLAGQSLDGGFDFLNSAHDWTFSPTGFRRKRGK
jgi:hypothetical protein